MDAIDGDNPSCCRGVEDEKVLKVYVLQFAKW